MSDRSIASIVFCALFVVLACNDSSDGDADSGCPASQIDCGGACVDPNTDELHCGASDDCLGPNAGVVCPAGELCDGAGVCALSCQAGLLECDGICTDPDTNEAYCGASGDCVGSNAGDACLSGEVCDDGTCEPLFCTAAFIDCNGVCVDPNNDPSHCGAAADCVGPNAGLECPRGHTCVNGTCTAYRSWGTESFVAPAHPRTSAFAGNADGDLIIAWATNNGGAFGIYYEAASSTWSDAELLEIGDAQSMRAGMDSAGNVMAVWRQYHPPDRDIVANRYDASASSWGAPEIIDTIDGEDAYPPSAAFASNGDATVVWWQIGDLYASHYDATSSTWSSPQVIETQSDSITDHDVEVFPNGDVIAVWMQGEFDPPNADLEVWTNRYDASAASWEGAYRIDSNSGGLDRLDLAVDPEGNVFVTWTRFTTQGTPENLLVTRFDSASATWGTPVILDPTPGNATIVAGPSGEAFLTWSGAGVFYRRYDPASSTWGPPETIAANTGGALYGDQVAFDATGAALAVWTSGGELERDVWANRYHPTTDTWGVPELLENHSNRPSHSKLVVRPDGTAVATWRNETVLNEPGPPAGWWASFYE